MTPLQGSRAGAAVVDMNPERGGELERFLPPVVQHAGGADDQAGPSGCRAAFHLRQQMRQRLQGFAEAHVIGKDAAQPMPRQGTQPAESIHLIGTQLRLQPGKSSGSTSAPPPPRR